MTEESGAPQRPTFKTSLLPHIEQAKKSLVSLAEERKAKKEFVIMQMAKYIPEATLVGGWALRLHMQSRGMTVPDMPAMDIDYTIAQTDYDKVRAVFAFPGEQVITSCLLDEDRRKKIQDHFRRKGDHEPVPSAMGGGYRSFMKDPDHFMALEDKMYEQHIDLNASDEVWAEMIIPLGDTQVKIISPEELLIRRAQQIQRHLAPNAEGKIQLPRKMHQYFYLNADLIDQAKMADTWKRSNTENDWETELINLSEKIERGISDKSIELVDVYH